jgi:hypothetical protein
MKEAENNIRKKKVPILPRIFWIYT